MRTADYETPSLLLDVDAAERNIRRMGEFFRGKKAALRPHIKVHKSPWLAHKQIAAGAIGVTCAKVSEAEVMAAGGIQDILIANEMVGDDKILRLVNLAKLCDVTVTVDDLGNARQISSIASRSGSKVRVVVDLNLSGAVNGILDRAGVPPGKQAVGLAQAISQLPNLIFSGLNGYEGSLDAFPDETSKVEGGKKALALLVQTADEVRASGLEVGIVSCGGTKSYQTAAEFPGVTEVQAGGYVFMDLGYRQSGVDFETSLTVLTRVVSRPRADKAIVDAGHKTTGTQLGLPAVRDRDDLQVVSLNAEHGHILVKDPSRGPKLAERLELLPSHADFTTCLHDKYVLVRRGEVEGYIPIEARGKLE